MAGGFPFRRPDAVLLFSPDSTGRPDANFFRHSNTTADSCALLISKKGKTIICPQMNARQCESESECKVAVIKRGEKLPSVIERLLPRRRKFSFGLDMENISAEKYLRLKAAMKNASFTDVSAQLAGMRMAKTPAEISKIRKAAKLSGEILQSLHFSSSMSELDVVRQLSLKCAERNLLFAYPPIVATGANSSMPHHAPGKKRLSGITLIDFGVKYENYCADLTRCFFIGSCREERKKYSEAQEIFHDILDGAASCETAGDIAKLADSVVKKHNWPEMIHAPGHGLGLEVHEAPRLSLSSHERLSDGVVLAIEPGWYGKKFGVRFENDIVLGGKSARVLL